MKHRQMRIIRASCRKGRRNSRQFDKNVRSKVISFTKSTTDMKEKNNNSSYKNIGKGQAPDDTGASNDDIKKYMKSTLKTCMVPVIDCEIIEVKISSKEKNSILLNLLLSLSFLFTTVL